jgi:hypothetical protein
MNLNTLPLTQAARADMWVCAPTRTMLCGHAHHFSLHRTFSYSRCRCATPAYIPIRVHHQGTSKLGHPPRRADGAAWRQNKWRRSSGSWPCSPTRAPTPQCSPSSLLASSATAFSNVSSFGIMHEYWMLGHDLTARSKIPQLLFSFISFSLSAFTFLLLFWSILKNSSKWNLRFVVT